MMLRTDMRTIVKDLGRANLAVLAGCAVMAGCGGTQPQTTGFGGGTPGFDPMAGNGSLGTGPAKGNIAKKQPDLGLDATLNGFKIFDDASIWNKNVEKTAVDPNSDKIIAKIGADKPLTPTFGAYGPNKVPFGIPYVVVSADAPKISVTFTDSKASDPGPYPFPLQMPIEAGDHAHAIVIDRDSQKLYESLGTKVDGATYDAISGTVWDLRTYTPRKSFQEAGDPSGLPVFPGLVRFDEVSDIKGINHPLRVTLATVSKNFVLPATRSSGTKTDADLPPMGTQLRLKKSFKISKFSPSNQVILTALKKYGMIVSDTGTDMGLSGTPDPHWMDSDLAGLKSVTAGDFEVLKPPAPPKLTKKEQAAADAAAAAAATATPTVTTNPAPAPTPSKS